MKKIYILFVILFVACMLAADNNHAAAYMKMGTDAKAMGMGGAVTSSIDNVNAAYWNPANLNFIKTLEISSTFNDLGLDRDLNYFALGKNFDFGVLALSWMNSSVDELAGYDINNNPTGEFGVGENNIALSFARSWNRLNAGINLKYYISDFEDEETESAFGIDLGLNYELTEYKMKLALMLRDLYSSELAGQAVPMQYTLGAAYIPYDYLTLEADIKGEAGEDLEYSLGAEYWNWVMPEFDKESFFNDTKGGLRIGLRNNNFTAGFGVKVRWIEFNYAYINEEFADIFGDTHQFSLIFRPNDECSRPEPKPVVIYKETEKIVEKEPVKEEIKIVNVSGFLLDELGNPVLAEIAWKPVGMDWYSEFSVSDIDGYFEVYLEENQTYEYMVDAQGYYLDMNKISVKDYDICNFDIMLSKLDFSEYMVNFELDSAIIKEESYSVLNDVVSVMLGYPDTKIEIAGHTDNTGSFAYNKKLSMDRACAVKAYLIEHGVREDQLFATGYGFVHPLGDNAVTKGRAENRRIELNILESGVIHQGILGCVCFEADSCELNDYSKACLNILANQLLENAAVKIEIGAFTKGNGSNDANLELSKKQAQIIVDYLISRGVSPESLEAKGYGDKFPVENGYSTFKKGPDSRIEIKILSVSTLKSGVLDEVSFEDGVDVFTPESFPQLNTLAAQMLSDSGMKIKINAYTDNIGEKEASVKLSQSRADAVAIYLLMTGVSEDRVISEGFGQRNPIADNSTIEGRKKNNRIEIEILSVSGSKLLMRSIDDISPEIKILKPEKVSEVKKVEHAKKPMPVKEKQEQVKKEAPPKIKKVEKKEVRRVLKNVYFESGKSELIRKSFPALNELAAEMMADSEMRIEVCGYTDNIGSKSGNLILSQKRAESVVNYLVSAGISKERITAFGFGSADPIANNDTLEGRAKNRRIEIKVLEK